MKAKHPLHEMLKNLGACKDALAWVAQHEPTEAPQALWDTCPKQSWKDWLRAALIGTADPAWLTVANSIHGFYPAAEWGKAAARRGPAHETRAFFARVVGRVRVATTRCGRCDGRGCRGCGYKGRVREEPLHPADAWTLAKLAEIEQLRAGVCP